jgi:hypothetical protein
MSFLKALEHFDLILLPLISQQKRHNFGHSVLHVQDLNALA